MQVCTNEHAGADLIAQRRVFDGIVTDLVRQAQTEGAVRPDVEPATAARLLFGMVNSLTEWYRPRRGSADLRRGGCMLRKRLEPRQRRERQRCQPGPTERRQKD